MKRRTLIIRILASVLMGCFSVSAICQHTSEEAAHTAYNEAHLHAAATFSPLSDGQAISFVEIYQSENGNTVIQPRTLHLDEKGEEIITPVKSVNSEEGMSWQSSILVSPNRFPKRATVLKETEEAWVFSIPSRVMASAGTVDERIVEEEIDVEKANANIASALVTELMVSKAMSNQPPRFISLKTYAKKPFHPESMVKVKEFSVVMEFAPAWQDGPLVTVSMLRRLKARYAWLLGVNEQTTIHYEQFQLVQ